jgi:hypothetical protein
MPIVFSNSREARVLVKVAALVIVPAALLELAQSIDRPITDDIDYNGQPGGHRHELCAA